MITNKTVPFTIIIVISPPRLDNTPRLSFCSKGFINCYCIEVGDLEKGLPDDELPPPNGRGKEKDTSSRPPSLKRWREASGAGRSLPRRERSLGPPQQSIGDPGGPDLWRPRNGPGRPCPARGAHAQAARRTEEELPYATLKLAGVGRGSGEPSQARQRLRWPRPLFLLQQRRLVKGKDLQPYSTTTMGDLKAVIKTVDMSEEMQQDSVECATQALEKYSVEKDIAAYIKKEFDKKYNPTWHCIVGRKFGSYVTHETKHFIYFYLGQMAILLFKSG
ncbi:Dynein light chain 1, cytoplasmic [Galemys pyrenaicus]|uniref:Dynein light chain 1, cytoplasmic n=1 Tax=Galemys pyrenaicus TaxID=202257 RepID=A0A8J6A090_GALPY|nr:Dynein light chain 1, cytoplasmic [Galemys pyrenaicus]